MGLRVFVDGPNGGNPVPLVRHAAGMSAQDMQAVAARHGHESAFVFASETPQADWTLRFFVPRHEMEMCGHATVGALWALRAWGEWTTPTARVQTRSGLVDAFWDAAREQVWVSQPPVEQSALAPALAARVLGVLDPLQRAHWHAAVVNARTSRTKTLARVASVAELDALAPSLDQVEASCAAADSTGLYPYAVVAGTGGAPVVAARQFPRSSGYPEDAATGIAAAALWGHLASTGTVPLGTPAAPATTTVLQGVAMGCPSAIALQARFGADGQPAGCWLGGRVVWSAL
ncbi:PhzF family phenazine biosynthesis protein [Pseudorhodoferax sp.]|uniref:PhzF family phenazine biosynthesis protein n=1 Tax=Pseudorhodoferax sp. TaxID=1993553 RepID=UPI002DD66349|nr:PhzF family phenazine biosynthesis isomerase [Pseudorhodoferax sp.]